MVFVIDIVAKIGFFISSWLLAVGGWLLAVGGWRLAVGDWLSC